MGSEPDGAIIEASLVDPSRFGVIFDRHYPSIVRYALRRIGDRGEEVAAETFVIAFESRAAFRSETPSARSWLFGIATNVIRHAVRHERRRLQALARLGHDIPPADPSDPDRLAAIEAAPLFARELLHLSPRDRDISLLVALEDLSYFEVAEALSMTPATVKTRFHRIRVRILERSGVDRAIQDDGS